jgi:hypothetical protein
MVYEQEVRDTSSYLVMHLDLDCMKTWAARLSLSSSSINSPGAFRFWPLYAGDEPVITRDNKLRVICVASESGYNTYFGLQFAAAGMRLQSTGLAIRLQTR